MKQQQIQIDPEFEAVIPPLTAEELTALEENLLHNGCRHALVLWNGILVDGHNRYKICKKHDIAFRTTDLERIDSRESVIAWMIDNQLARRNLPDLKRVDLALKKKAALVALAQKKQKAGANQHSSLLTNLSKGSAMNTRRDVAKAAGVSEGTVAKVEKINVSAVREVLEMARSDEIKIDVAFQVATLPEKEQVALATAGPDAMKAAAKDLRKSKQDRNAAEDARSGSAGRNANPKTDMTSKDRNELVRLRAENVELRDRVKQLTKASKNPELKCQLADTKQVNERLNKWCLELTDRIAVLEKENEVLVRHLGMQSQENQAVQRQTDAIDEHADTVELKQGMSDPAGHSASDVAIDFPAAKAEPGADINVLDTVELHVIDTQCAEKGIS